MAAAAGGVPPYVLPRCIQKELLAYSAHVERSVYPSPRRPAGDSAKGLAASLSYFPIRSPEASRRVMLRTMARAMRCTLDDSHRCLPPGPSLAGPLVPWAGQRVNRERDLQGAIIFQLRKTLRRK
ncbi:hypothetical protein MRX96_023539 [Rhipicephalus microplus]